MAGARGQAQPQSGIGDAERWVERPVALRDPSPPLVEAPRAQVVLDLGEDRLDHTRPSLTSGGRHSIPGGLDPRPRQGRSTTAPPAPPPIAAARASAASSSGNVAAVETSSFPVATNSASSPSARPSGSTITDEISMPRCSSGGSRVIVARCPPSRTVPIATAEPSGAAFATALTPDPPP